MRKLEPSGVMQALLVFADIIESSRLSAYLGPINYAEQLIKFQDVFENLGRKYFPKKEDRILAYSQIIARGDEGILFCVDDDISKNEMVYKALEFLFELKGRLRTLSLKDENQDRPIRKIDLGAGIHYGPVAVISALEKEKGRARSVIERLEGYSINYAKRTESCSRRGNFSRIILSKEAANALEGEAILLAKMIEPMKGFGENVEVFEVQSAFFHDIPISASSPEDESFMNYINQLADHPVNIEESWMKTLVVSVLESRIKTIELDHQKGIYHSRLLKLVWNSPNEDDPILLFMRAREYEEKGKQTARIKYLKQILDRFPEFIPARKKIADACWKISKGKAEKAEKVYARDVAEEFLSRFPDYLSEAEKQNFEIIVKELGDKQEENP